MNFELILQGGYKEPFSASVDFVAGRTYKIDTPVTKFYQLDLMIEILDKKDATTLGSQHVSGWVWPIKIYCYNSAALKVDYIELSLPGKRTILESNGVPNLENGQVIEKNFDKNLWMPDNGRLEQEVDVKGEYEAYTFGYWPEYAYPVYYKEEYSIDKITIYATEIQYKLSFNMNGGDGSVSSRQLKPGRVISSPLFTFNRPTRSGFSFVGWSQTAADVKPQYPLLHSERFSGTPSFPGEKSFTMPNHNCVLYAIWHTWTYRPLTQNGVIIHKRENGVILRDGDG